MSDNHLARAITVALELLGDGDQAGAVDVLLASQESDDIDTPLRCRFCPRRFAWAGEREAHELQAHAWELVAAEEDLDRAA